MYDHLPGGEILEAGLRDLHAGSRSVAALLVLVAAPRLVRCGIVIPGLASGDSRSALPEHDLFRSLAATHGPEAYRHYRSLMRRLASLVQALENAVTQTPPGETADTV
jgi:hypothetical protein